VLRFLSDKLNKELSALGDQTLSELDLVPGAKDVVTVTEDASVLDAFKILNSKGLSSIALVNHKGELMANLSMADIKYLLQFNRLDLLFQSTKHFIQEVRLAKDKEHEYKSQAPIFTVTKDTSFKHAVGKLLATKSHRMWVTKDSLAHHPIGVITLSDILRVLTPKATAKKHWPFISFVPAK